MGARAVRNVVVLTLYLSVVHLAWSQTPCGSPGPDVIVSDLFGYVGYGNVGNIAALSFGTTSCNVGDTPVSWEEHSSQHPVIGQNMFRLLDGRFEQIGQAWLKHGFASLNQELCGCDCLNPGTYALLGVGCSDPYDASLNGVQGGLGPKFEVNPHTGAFPWPFTAAGQVGNAIYKRLQVATADLDPALNPDAVYFIEGQYVAPDDAGAGNGNNNASHRQVVPFWEGNKWRLSYTGMPPTQAERPAIMAWSDRDPEVQVAQVQIPNEGLLILAARATYLGNGVYHYEYALHNLNSDRAVGAFNVPIPDGIAPGNFGFHDVSYHSGEPFDGTDWAAAVVGTQLTWSTVSYDVNPDANALRWGTLYNFRFDAFSSPGTGNLKINLFKPGTPGTVSALMVAPAPPLIGDLNGDCLVDLTDLSTMLVNFGGSGGMVYGEGDVDGDGDIDLDDLSALLVNFGSGCV